MNSHRRRLTRLLTGILAVGIVTATLLAPTTSANAEPVPTTNCLALLADVDTARHDLRAARVAYRAAYAARSVARLEYDAEPTRRHLRALRAARADLRESRSARSATRSVYDLAEANYLPYAPCLPSVAVSNTRVEHYGNDFAVAEFTWSNVPNGNYHVFYGYGDAAAQDGFSYTEFSHQGPRTFVDVLPPKEYCDPYMDYESCDDTHYLQNGVTYTDYLGSGCAYTPGENISVELWTDKEGDGTQPVGLKIASAMVDNPCR